jgi:hypothetical protein
MATYWQFFTSTKERGTEISQPATTGASSTPIRRILAHPPLLGGPVGLAAVVFQLPLGRLFQDLETMSWVTDLGELAIFWQQPV